ncbi:MAG: hypothetical protein A3D92_18675 [Bacteroidetes bacterium RIFCSPHIGHO2_02_FULL_44_7]|nr:MAG: hypothetical protein A3D92_18675 [Bacteroidetes bacterium RIFCSPHIGHO2_02_FULL_44_7]
MENRIDTGYASRERNTKLLFGILVIIFGILFLMKRQGTPLPNWVISWKTIMIAAGVLQLYKHRFRSFFAYALIGVGTAMLINDFQPNTIDRKLIAPILVIFFGAFILAKHLNLLGNKKNGSTTLFDDDREVSSEDYIKSTAVFGGVTKNVVSKSFKGAKFNTVFGGTDINLTKADIEGPIRIKSTTVFGGVTLIVPSNWEVRSEITAIAGAVEDQRGIASDVTYDPSKVVVLTGTCLFGGVEIRSYV